ncbi:hypothetical protein RSOLAG22IIIB_03004 [Rhizoctonia solani]|uniref:Uncharacterized protein n=1 Tax=Rhizoctonia solani TaxID=456999 RepID=A0A0K6FM97_9AGAM|nr:hypothetical protein RSOLAG22IIIB_03004 [Rhizoctonia solani]
MFTLQYPNNCHSQNDFHVSKGRYSSAAPADKTNPNSRSTKEAEYLAGKPSIQAHSQNKRRTSVGYGYFEPSQHRRPSDPKISVKTSDRFSLPIPTSPFPDYSYPPQYSALRRSKGLPKEASPEPQRRASTCLTSHEVSPPPKYHKEDVVDFGNLYCSKKARPASRTLPRSKPIDEITLDSIYSLVEDHTVDMTPQKPGRLALAAAREDRSSKKEFESYKRQTRNQAPSRTEELDNDPEIDDLHKNILGDIAAIGRSSSCHAETTCATTRGAFDHAFGRD